MQAGAYSLPRQAAACAGTLRRIPCQPGAASLSRRVSTCARTAMPHTAPVRGVLDRRCARSPPAHALPRRTPCRPGRAHSPSRQASACVCSGTPFTFLVGGGLDPRRASPPPARACHAASHVGPGPYSPLARLPPAYAPPCRIPCRPGAASITGAPVLHLRVHAPEHSTPARGLTRRSSGLRLRGRCPVADHHPGAPSPTCMPGPACACTSRRRTLCRRRRPHALSREASACARTFTPHTVQVMALSITGAPSLRLLMHRRAAFRAGWGVFLLWRAERPPAPTRPPANHAGRGVLPRRRSRPPPAHVLHAAAHAGRGVLRAATPSLRLRMRCHAAYPQPGASSLTCMPGLRLPMHRHAAYRHAGRGALMPCHARRPPAHAPRRRKPCKPERSRSPARQASACACSSRCIPPCKPGRPLSPSRPAFPCACAPFRIARRILSARGAIT